MKALKSFSLIHPLRNDALKISVCGASVPVLIEGIHSFVYKYIDAYHLQKYMRPNLL